MGYHRAGFDVVGVDIEPQPNYPFKFWQHDALSFLQLDPPQDIPSNFDAVHASPPCQAHVKGLAEVNRKRGRELDHVDLIAATRERLIATGLPYVIENVEGAPLLNPVRLCGSSFRMPIQRHRLFESNVALMVPPCNHSWQNERKYWTSRRVNGKMIPSKVVQVYGGFGPSDEWGEAMGIDWMTRDELREAIPPVYTEHIGGYLLNYIRDTVAA
jgi:DNA (cytosine-5)-methyltransferase 1